MPSALENSVPERNHSPKKRKGIQFGAQRPRDFVQENMKRLAVSPDTQLGFHCKLAALICLMAATGLTHMDPPEKPFR